MRALAVASETYLRINDEGVMCIQHQIMAASGKKCYVDFLMVPYLADDDGGDNDDNVAVAAEAARRRVAARGDSSSDDEGAARGRPAPAAAPAAKRIALSPSSSSSYSSSSSAHPSAHPSARPGAKGKGRAQPPQQQPAAYDSDDSFYGFLASQLFERGLYKEQRPRVESNSS